MRCFVTEFEAECHTSQSAPKNRRRDGIVLVQLCPHEQPDLVSSSAERFGSPSVVTPGPCWRRKSVQTTQPGARAVVSRNRHCRGQPTSPRWAS